MTITARFLPAAIAASFAFAMPARAQLIQYTTTGFFTGGGATPCTTAVIGSTATCSYANGSVLQFNNASQQNVVKMGTSNFGSFQTMGSAWQSYLGNSFTLQILQTSPSVDGSMSIVGSVTGDFSASPLGGTGGLIWTPSITEFIVGEVFYRVLVDNTGGIDIQPPAPGGTMGDVQTIRGSVSVPEPDAWLLMASGLAGVGLMVRRRRSA